MQEVCSLAHTISERKQGDKTNLDVLANLIYCLGNHRDPSLVDCCFVMSFVACWWLMEIKWWFGEVPTQRRGFGSNPFLSVLSHVWVWALACWCYAQPDTANRVWAHLQVQEHFETNRTVPYQSQSLEGVHTYWTVSLLKNVSAYYFR